MCPYGGVYGCVLWCLAAGSPSGMNFALAPVSVHARVNLHQLAQYNEVSKIESWLAGYAGGTENEEVKQKVNERHGRVCRLDDGCQRHRNTNLDWFHTSLFCICLRQRRSHFSSRTCCRLEYRFI